MIFESAHSFTWSRLAARVWMSREYARQCAYVLLYDGQIDPWLDSIVRRELDELIAEAKRHEADMDPTARIDLPTLWDAPRLGGLE